MKNFNSYVKGFLNDVIKTATSRQLLKSHLRIPLYQNAYYLTANSAASSLLGFIFWIIVARLYSPAHVGLAAAIISALGLLAVLSGLGLGLGLIRFLPQARQPIKMINSSFTIAGVASVLTSVVFLIGLDLWSPVLIFLRQHTIYIASFILFAMAWSLTDLVDQVFVAHRFARFTFLKNIIGATLKIPLAIMMVILFRFGAFGIYGSAGVATIIALGIALFYFLRRVEKSYFPCPALSKGVINDMFHYSQANYIAALLWGAPALLFPLMVVNISGVEANAYFYAAWSIGTAAAIFPSALSVSLFAEGSTEEEAFFASTKRVLKLNLLILLPVIVLIFALADKVLLLFGEAYSHNATILLRILTLSTLPLSLNYIYLTMLRVRKSLKRLIGVSAIAAGVSLGLAYFLIVRIGILGVGVGWITGQSLVTIVTVSCLFHKGYLTHK